MAEQKLIPSPLFPHQQARHIMDLDWARVQKQYQLEYGISLPDLSEEKTLSIYHCERSDFRFYHPVIEGDEHFYTALAKGSTYYPVWKWEHEFAMKHIQKGDKVLEVGCGAGDFLLALHEKKEAKAVGLELGEGQCAEVRQKGLDCRAERLEEHASKTGGFYDVVCFFQVLEHIAEPLDFLRSALKVLKPGGLLIFAVPNNTPYLYGCDVYHTLNLPPHHQGLWNMISVKSLSTAIPALDLKHVATEPLSIAEIDAHLAVYRRYSQAPPWIWKPFHLLPKRYWKQWSVLAGLQGRNLAAAFIKKV